MSSAEVGEVKMNLKAWIAGTNTSMFHMRQWSATYLKEDSTTKKPLFYVADVTFPLRIEECGPRIRSDNVFWVTITDMSPRAKRNDKSVHQRRECQMMAAHVASSQLYSMGHKRRPVSSCSKPWSSLDIGGRGADRGAPSMLGIQLTTAGFRLAASSPLAPPDPFLS
jgi:hypothetical protein